jgi:hypothetical protein
MPGQPVVQQKPLPAGGTQTTVLVGGKTSVFGVSYLDLPPARANLPADQIFSDALKGAQANMPGSQVQADKKISLANHPGKEWDLFLNGKGHLLVQAFLVNGRTYLLLAGGDTFTATSPEVRTFFNSFKLLSR